MKTSEKGGPDLVCFRKDKASEETAHGNKTRPEKKLRHRESGKLMVSAGPVSVVPNTLQEGKGKKQGS